MEGFINFPELAKELHNGNGIYNRLIVTHQFGGIFFGDL